jgi:cytosine/adenosine deaminase-related metal-dependent hydrolase
MSRGHRAEPAEPDLSRTVLRGARWPGDVAFSGGRITAVGSVPAQDGDTVVDCAGDILTAGLVNTHHHFFQWMTRGWAHDRDLFGWLTTLYPVWARLAPEDVAAAAAVALGELALTGCTTAADHHYLVPGGDDSFFDAIAGAARTIGLRTHIARGSMNLGESGGGLPPDSVVEDRDAILASTQAVYDRLHDGDRIVVTVGPCSPFTVTPELMTDSARLARQLGLRLHTHLAETLDEERSCLELFGKRPLALLDDLGWIAPDVWLAHGIHFDDAEVARLGQTRTGVAHCPSSNCRLGAGICRTTDLIAAGAPVGLGVDGAASNEIGGLQPELRMALYLARQRSLDPSAFGPADALRLATEGGARCLGRDDVGRLEPGLRADVVVWPGDDLADVLDPLAGLVLGPERTARHVFVGGDYVVRDGALVGADIVTLRAELARRARRLWPERAPAERGMSRR